MRTAHLTLQFPASPPRAPPQSSPLKCLSPPHSHSHHCTATSRVEQPHLATAHHRLATAHRRLATACRRLVILSPHLTVAPYLDKVKPTTFITIPLISFLFENSESMFGFD
ncbi:hypothetical protein ACOSP7_020514 [Xanthoceras sorbifolium]